MTEEKLATLRQWAADVCEQEPQKWERMPEIDLYMDQVITWINRQLEPVESGDKKLTSSMINNYVKGGVLPRPLGKKYTRDHLGLLLAVCMLKSELPLPAIRGQIASGLDIIVHLGRLRDRSRRVLEIVEVLGYEEGQIQTRTLYEFKETGEDADGRIQGDLYEKEELYNRQKLRASGLS